MNDQPHDRFAEMSGLYVLDTLTDDERAGLQAHLRTCGACRAEVASLEPVADRLLAGVPLVTPPRELRDRVLRAVTGEAPPPATQVVPFATTAERRTMADMPGRTRAPASIAPWLAAAAAAIVAVVASTYAWNLRAQVTQLASQLQEARLDAERRNRELAEIRTVALQAQSTVSVLSAPDLRRVELQGQQPLAPRAHARAFWSRSRGLVFTATELPPLPPGKVYQLWFVTNVAVSAGLLQPDARGQVSAVLPTDPAMGEPVAMAVTLEPAGGVPAPTGEKYLIGTPAAGI